MVVIYEAEYKGERYQLEGRIEGLYSGCVEIRFHEVQQNLTWTEDTLLDEVILDLANEAVER